MDFATGLKSEIVSVKFEIYNDFLIFKFLKINFEFLKDVKNLNQISFRDLLT